MTTFLFILLLTFIFGIGFFIGIFGALRFPDMLSPKDFGRLCKSVDKVKDKRGIWL